VLKTPVRKKQASFRRTLPKLFASERRLSFGVPGTFSTRTTSTALNLIRTLEENKRISENIFGAFRTDVIQCAEQFGHISRRKQIRLKNLIGVCQFIKNPALSIADDTINLNVGLILVNKPLAHHHFRDTLNLPFIEVIAFRFGKCGREIRREGKIGALFPAVGQSRPASCPLETLSSFLTRLAAGNPCILS